MKKPGILAVMSLALAATLSPVAAAQAAPAPNGTVAVGLPTGVESPGATSTPVTTAAPAAGGACDYVFPGNAPTNAVYLCGTQIIRLNWPDGRYEYVLIGSDRQVWHSYQYSAGGSWSVWGTLGNSHDVQGGVWGWFSGGNPTVQVLGGDGGYWCNTFNGNGTWTNWYGC